MKKLLGFALAIGLAGPALGADNVLINQPNGQFAIISATDTAGVKKLNVNCPTCSGGGSTTITANSTPTSGFAANTIPYSDGSLIQVLTPGTGVFTALGINIGSAGAPVLFNGAGGTPSSLTGTNITGTAASLTAGTVTTNANLTGDVTSVGNAATLAWITRAASQTLAIGAGGTLGSNAFTSTAYAPLASPTFTGTVTLPDASTFGTNFAIAGNAILTAPSAAKIQHGAANVNGAPVAQTISFQGALAGSATNQASVNTTTIGSLGTGTGTNGDFIFQVGVKTTTGTVQATPTTALTIKGETLNVQLATNLTVNSSIALGGDTSQLFIKDTVSGTPFVSFRNPTIFNLASTVGLTWSSTSNASGGTVDTTVSRVSAGIIQVGTTAQNALGSLNLTNLTATGTIKLAGFTVAGLPGSPTTGMQAYVTDAVACTFLATVTGGGSAFCPVIWNGSAWQGG